MWLKHGLVQALSYFYIDTMDAVFDEDQWRSNQTIRAVGLFDNVSILQVRKDVAPATGIADLLDIEHTPDNGWSASRDGSDAYSPVPSRRLP